MEIKIELNHTPKNQKKLEQYFLWLLSRKDYFTIQLKKKALEKGYALEEILVVLTKFASEGFIDDARLLQKMIDSYQTRGKSKREIFAKLLIAGVSQENIEKALSEQKDTIALKKLMRKAPINPSYEDKQKFVAKLLRKGFSMTEVLEQLRHSID